MNANPVRAVFFDLDGTLVETTAAFYRRYFELLAAEFPGGRGAELVQAVMAATEEVRREGERAEPVGERILQGMARRMAMEVGTLSRFFDRFYATVFSSLAGTVHPIPGVARLLDAARGLGVPLGVASDPVFPKDVILQRLRWGGLDPAWFELTLGAEAARALKPARAYFLQLAEIAGVSPEACAFLGNDPDHDGAARAAGMRVFLLRGAAHAVTHRNAGETVPEGAAAGSLDDAVRWLSALPTP
ncbi:MAG: HAD family hydrolase [Firmicutes bacterium]|nr:HAD family hydrolase [Bacillota bacterium]